MRTEREPTVFPVPWVTEVGVAVFFTVAFTLLLTRPDYHPIRRYVSEYAVGPGGWAMRTAFVMLGLASLNLVPGFLRGAGRERGRDARRGPGPDAQSADRVGWALGVWGVAVLAAAAFPVDVRGAERTGAGMVHLVTSGVGFVALFAAMGLAVRAFRESEGWRELARPTRWVAIMTPTAFLLEASVFSTAGWVGVGQWLLFGQAYSNCLLAVNRKTGRTEWSVALGQPMFPHWPSPVVAGDLVYLPRQDGALYAVDWKQRKQAWMFYLGDVAQTGPQLPKNLLPQGWDHAAWKPAVGDALYATPAIAADGTIVLGSGQGWLYAIEQEPAE